MQNTNTNDAALEAKVTRIVTLIKSVVMFVLVAALVVGALVIVLEIKRAFQIDIFKGVNFTVDDWYFDKVAK
jgi:hypothetical protein